MKATQNFGILALKNCNFCKKEVFDTSLLQYSSSKAWFVGIIYQSFQKDF